MTLGRLFKVRPARAVSVTHAALFYNVALLAALVLSAPWWLWKMATTHKYREGMMQRLGWVRFGPDGPWKGRLPWEKRLPNGRTTPESSIPRPLIWVHAVSVGEVLAVSRLVKTLDAAWPDYFVAVSTTTRTGQALARERSVPTAFLLPARPALGHERVPQCPPAKALHPGGAGFGQTC